MNLFKITAKNWYKDYNNWVSLVEWLVGVIVVFLLAKLFWVWLSYFLADKLSTKTDFSAQASQASQPQSSDKTNIQPLLAMNLFGSVVVEQAPEENIAEVPETKLDLELTCIYASEDPKKSNACIQNGRGKQAVYFVDEQLEDVMGRVFLRDVYPDRVILETNGKKEILRLHEDEQLAQLLETKSQPKPSRNMDRRNDRELTQDLADYKEQFLDDPQSIMDIVKGRPHFIDGELRGFRVSPGRDAKLFKDLGLKSGDIITSVNGIAFTNVQDAMSLMNEAQSIENMDVEIQRGDETLSLLLNLQE
jgi:general secretion pathway protein C